MSKRLTIPERFKNRWSYAITAFAISLIFILIGVGIIGLIDKDSLSMVTFEHPVRGVAIIAGTISLPTALIAGLSWPTRSERTRSRMAWTGILTVMLAYFFQGIIRTGPYYLENSQAGGIVAIVGWALAVVIFGGLATLGIPYLIAALVSTLFADSEILDDPSKPRDGVAD